MSVRLFREAYGIHGSCGILFNHEGARRGENFVTRKITKWLGECHRFLIDNHDGLVSEITFSEDHIHASNCRRFSKLRLGNLEAQRDWGHAKDYVRAMWMMLQQEKPDDYVICTGETRTVKQFLDVAFGELAVKDWSNYVVIDPEFYRPAEVDFLLGDCTKAKNKLGWKPEFTFEQLVKEMVDNDL
jgi:GDPmannose 4,6-dehydratase